MGKKGTKRKTRWRTLPLAGGEDGCNSGNEDDAFEEDQSTSSSAAGQSGHRQYQQMYRVGEKPYRQTRRYPYDRNRFKEPLVKLENKTFDEEEYTKITTPRQDVLFKKGYLGRKRPESSTDETPQYNGEGDTETEVMEQLIITNGFVDERGHYLMNGSSYEIYDPYSNTVTVVVGPPPYPNGVTSPPVLAAVSCQPVPLPPVEWYPPPTHWVPPFQPADKYKRLSQDSVSPLQSPTSQQGLDENGIVSPTPNGPPVYNQALPFVLPGYLYGQQAYDVNGVAPIEVGPHTMTSETSSNPTVSEKKVKRKRRRRRRTNGEEEELDEETSSDEKDDAESVQIEENTTEPINNHEEIRSNANIADKPLNEMAPPFVLPSERSLPPDTYPVEKKSSDVQTEEEISQDYIVRKESHSTQTGLLESQNVQRMKESHSTQTSPEETPQVVPNERNGVQKPKSASEALMSSLMKSPKNKSPTKRFYNNENRFTKRYSRNYGDIKVPRNVEENNQVNSKSEIDGRDAVTKERIKEEENGFRIVSYAKKVINGVSNNVEHRINGSDNQPKFVNDEKHRIPNGVDSSPKMNGKTEDIRKPINRQMNRSKYNDQNKTSPNSKARIEFKGKDRKPNPKKPKVPNQLLDIEKRFSDHSETSIEPQSQSEKSSTISELSSPTELSSGQNTPPETVKKNEEIGFEEKLTQNLKAEESVRKEEPIVAAEEIEVKLDLEIEAEDNVNDDECVKETKEVEKQGNKKKKKKAEVVQVQKATGKKTKKKKKEDKPEVKEEETLKDKITFTYADREIPFLPNFLQSKPKEYFLSSFDTSFKPSKTELDEILSSEDNDILKSIHNPEEKFDFSKIKISPEFLMMIPTFRPDRYNKFSFEDCFSKNTKNVQSEIFTKTNITSMKSTKPEEFFASIVENPPKVDYKKKTEKNTKKETELETERLQTADVKQGAQIVVKKNVYVPQSGFKLTKKNNKSPESVEKKKEIEIKKNDDVEQKEEADDSKLGIVEAVTTWLQSHDNPEEILSVASVPQSVQNSEAEESEDESDQKNVKSNPLHALSVNDMLKDNGIVMASVNKEGCVSDNECNRVATKRSEDGFIYDDIVTEPSSDSFFKKMNRTRSFDFLFHEKKKFNFLTQSASYYQDLFGSVRNGISPESEVFEDGKYVYGKEEHVNVLYDSKASVSKYYQLSPNIENKADDNTNLSDTTDSESEVFDALEYKFLTKDKCSCEKHKKQHLQTFEEFNAQIRGNKTCQEESTETINNSKEFDERKTTSVTDSGVYSETDSTDDIPIREHHGNVSNLSMDSKQTS